MCVFKCVLNGMVSALSIAAREGYHYCVAVTIDVIFSVLLKIDTLTSLLCNSYY